MKVTVILRRDKNDGHLVVFFPEIPWNMEPWICMCYAGGEGHGPAHKRYYTKDTEPATDDDFLARLAKLYDYDLRICKSWSQKMDKLRMIEINKRFKPKE